MQFKEFKLQRDPNTKPVEKLIDYQQFCGIPQQEEAVATELFSRISVADAKSKLDSGWQPFVLDVRKDHEIQIVSLDFVDMAHPHEQVQDIAATLPTDRDILIHCKMGGRSAKACQQLIDSGITRVYNLEGGITAWATEIDNSLPTY